MLDVIHSRVRIGIQGESVVSHMSGQSRASCESFLTVWLLACVQSFPGVRPAMTSKATRVIETHGTSWMLAYMRSLTRMHSLMYLQSRSLSEE